jgi:hypothetical protein
MVAWYTVDTPMFIRSLSYRLAIKLSKKSRRELAVSILDIEIKQSSLNLTENYENKVLGLFS